MIGFFAAQAMNQGPRLWTPANMVLPPVVWVDWDSTMTDVSGRISSVANKGSGGGAFVQDSSAQRPETFVGAGGIRGLKFSEGQILQSTSPGVLDFGRNTGVAWVFAAFESLPRTTNSANPVFAAPASNSVVRIEINAGFGIGATAITPYVFARRNSATPEAQAIAAPSSSTIAYAEMNFSGGPISISVNAAAPVVSAFTSPGPTSDSASSPAVAIGGIPGSGGLPHRLNGAVYAIIAGQGSPPSPTELPRLHGWIAHALDWSDRLPADHPYRHVPPYVNTPVLQPSFAASPAVYGFVAATDSGDIGVAAGPAVATAFGTLLDPEPTLGGGQGITTASASGTLTVRLDGIAPAATPAEAIVMDHRGGHIATVALSDGGGYYGGSASASLTNGGVYYVRVQAA